MKTLIAILIMFGMSATANAQCCEPKPQTCPKVRTKVVTKTVEKPVPVIVTQEKVVPVRVPVPVQVTRTLVKKVQKKNRLSVLGGSGPTKLSVTPSEARLERGAIIGAQYQRLVTESISLGVQVQSNETVLGSVGIDF